MGALGSPIPRPSPRPPHPLDLSLPLPPLLSSLVSFFQRMSDWTAFWVRGGGLGVDLRYVVSLNPSPPTLPPCQSALCPLFRSASYSLKMCRSAGGLKRTVSWRFFFFARDSQCIPAPRTPATLLQHNLYFWSFAGGLSNACVEKRTLELSDVRSVC